MPEFFTKAEVEQILRENVAECGGSAKKWCRKNKVNMDHALHMVANGSAATLPAVIEKLGFRAVTLYEPTRPQS
jgi:hypothetical protein